MCAWLARGSTSLSLTLPMVTSLARAQYSASPPASTEWMWALVSSTATTCTTQQLPKIVKPMDRLQHYSLHRTWLAGRARVAV